MRLLVFPAVLLVIMLVCFAPWVWLIHWATDLSLVFLLSTTLLVAPVYMLLSMKALRGGPDWFAWGSMQFLGLGSVGWWLLIPGWAASLFVPSHLVAVFFALAWVVLIILANVNANRLHNLFLNIKDHRIAKPTRLVQISDVHIGSRTPKFLEKVVDRVREHKPDLVLITGDLLDLSNVNANSLNALKRIEVPVYMCIGNHERYVDFENALNSIKANNVIVLRDEATIAGDIQLIGIDDLDKPDHVGEVLRELKLSPDHFSVVLYHRPDGWSHVKQHELPLMLAGHTHNGQVWPFKWLVKLQYPEICGTYEAETESATLRLHVSSGTGTWGPTFRLGTRCEVTVIDLNAN